MDALEDGLVLQEHEEPTYKPDPDREHYPLPTTEMGCTEMEELIEAEIWRRVDEIIDESLTAMITAVIPVVFS